MLGSPCNPCCAPPPVAVCGNTSQPYEGQTGILDSSGRWCLSGARPAEITIRYTAEASTTTFYSYRNLSGTYFSGYFFDTQRGYYAKRFKQTLTLNLGSINFDYVLRPNFFYAPNQQTAVCGYGFAELVDCPRLFAGYEPGSLTLNGVTYNVYAENEEFPAYTITFQSCNSHAEGTLLREYEYRPYEYVGNNQLQATGPWIRDPSLDTGGVPNLFPCRYSWSMTSRNILFEPACDLRNRNLMWYGNVLVSPEVIIFDPPLQALVNVTASNGYEQINGGPMLPQFSLSVTIVA